MATGATQQSTAKYSQRVQDLDEEREATSEKDASGDRALNEFGLGGLELGAVFGLWTGTKMALDIGA